MSCKCFNRRFVFKNTDSFDHKYVNSKCKCTSRFTICENKSKFTIASKDISEVDKIKIDGYFDSSSEHRKCDYLFVYTSPLNCVYIFVELKGTDIAHAITQIGKRLVLQPENIQTGFITFQNFIYRESAPAAFWIFL